MTEMWQSIPQFEGCYEVSSHGRVRSLERTVWRSDGVLQTIPERILKLADTGSSLVVHLRRMRDGKSISAHRAVGPMVAEAFIGPKPHIHSIVLRRNFDRFDNRVENIYWGRNREVAQRQIETGRHSNAAKTNCPRGHKLVEPNLGRAALRNGMRQCLACARTYNRFESANDRQPTDSPEFRDLSDELYDEIMKGVGTQ